MGIFELVCPIPKVFLKLMANKCKRLVVIAMFRQSFNVSVNLLQCAQEDCG
jgi:hypothetical protein